ncbi:helix-turn-helix transcriptional regulator [Natronosalvus caseinilyticus]|uniref:helix-turn-helix transcriptional regulator n=1 Tax=Natronosalvus caseinilyticus TaxID=2953747 RepID=UPI0028A8BF4B|nr:transcriptional regulator [Natronosalvus caseinilyticus]
MGSSINDIEFIASSNHRVGVLDALADGRCDRDDLRSATGASSPTMGRVLGDFEERHWIERIGRMYQLTPLGTFVAERFVDLREAMDTERRLRDVWRWLPREMEGFTVDLFADAVVAYPGPGYPYEPVARVIQLVEGSTSMRGLGTTVFKSIANETVCLAVLDGMEFEYVYPPDILAATVAWDPEMVERAATRDHCTVLVHDDLPDRERCGIGIFDDRVGICCHDADTRALRAWIDTDAPKAREWALSVFEHYRRGARPADETDMDAPVPEELTVP